MMATKTPTFRQQVHVLYRKHRKDNLPANHALRYAIYDAKYGQHSHKRDIMPSRYDAYEGEATHFLPNGWKIKVEIEYDRDSGPPDKEGDGHGETYRKAGYNYPDEHEREWELWSGHYEWLIYDFKASMKKALKEDWDAPPYKTGSKQEQALRAVKADYEFLRRYYNDDWWYVGMIVTLLDEDDNELGQDSCWGFDSGSMDYITEQVRDWAARLIKSERKERRELAYWRDREVMTERRTT